MNRYVLQMLMACIPAGLYAQEALSPAPTAHPAIQQIEAQPDKVSAPLLQMRNSAEAFRTYFSTTLPELSESRIALELVTERESAVGFHYMFRQTYKGIPVYGAYLKVNTDKAGTITSLINHLLHVSEATLASSNLPRTDFLLLNGNTLEPVMQNNHQLVNASGEVIKTLEHRFYLTDTVASGKVFNHDPLTTQGVIYGQDGTYKHFNDSDYALLNNQRVSVNFPATYDTGVFSLSSTYARIEDWGGPAVAPATSTSGVFDFTRGQDGFKDVMAYYHVLHTRDYFMSLGFTNRMQYCQRIDAHASIADNSYFAPDDTTLNFGTGGIPDAEDGDVVVHEYTHALSYDMTAVSNMTEERRAIEEGLCDVIAALQSYKTTTFNWRLLFNFDAPNPIATGETKFWAGRSAQSDKTYADMMNHRYKDCEIWSSCMLDIAEHATVGHDTLAILMLNAVYGMTGGTTMPQAAQLMLDVDSVLYNGRHQLIMGYFFNQRLFGSFPEGLADMNTLPDWIDLYNSEGFALGNGDLRITSKDATPFDIVVYNIAGQKIAEVKNNSNSCTLHPSDFGQGLYIINLQQGGNLYQQKLIRY